VFKGRVEGTDASIERKQSVIVWGDVAMPNVIEVELVTASISSGSCRVVVVVVVAVIST
jgi:hypothetical protein